MSKHKKKNVAPAYLDYPDEGMVEVTYPEGTVPGGGDEVKTMTFAAYLNSGTATSRAWKMTREMARLMESAKVVPLEGKSQPCETIQFLEDFRVDAKK